MSRLAHFERGDEVETLINEIKYTGIVVAEHNDAVPFPCVSVDIGLKRLDGMPVLCDKRETKKTGRRFEAIFNDFYIREDEG